jgi:hypothetical protein
MSSANGEPQLEYQSWSAIAEHEQAPAQRPSSAIEVRTPPIVAPELARVVEDVPSRGANALSTPITETGSRWRLVIHDNPNGIAADSRDNPPLFRPPSFSGSQTRMMRAQHPAAPKRSLEEETGHALRRLISLEIPTGANR